jgi:DNA-binding transcriptional MerR regulator
MLTVLPHVEVTLTAGELATAAGLSAARLAQLVRFGLVEATPPGSGTFTAATAARLRRMLRLRADLGVNLVGAAIVVDLLERLECLEAELIHRHGRLPRPATSTDKE